jgi:hypothetical protein
MSGNWVPAIHAVTSDCCVDGPMCRPDRCDWQFTFDDSKVNCKKCLNLQGRYKIRSSKFGRRAVERTETREYKHQHTFEAALKQLGLRVISWVFDASREKWRMRVRKAK